ncbi:MAG: polyphosphate kinase 2 family protein [Vulcanococcus sp.]|jgi:PPK2 family polyphosphate:nucleotide phosphotransferase|uniref:polyphosphate kinase 2 family protein n=1 Tax=Synechococcus sp. NB0720_010 TaxID=2907159 RepID=UPI001FFABF99|nr:polyphosphate kinase 2 family protein [Synechococcus sp. NB0720_010]UPH90068.1 polyphosphate kinase 2 family protein [Synechococcus sp. NB0720_010]
MERELSQVLTQCHHLTRPYRIDSGDGFRLNQIDPGDTLDLPSDKKAAREALEQGVQMLSELQQRLYAQNKWAVLLIFQAMDAAGKDGTIKHVMSGVNPQGCQVTSFKAPSALDLDHDYLWRANQALPERGRIGIFNRSYYEETLVVRVHPELLAKQSLPPDLVGPKLWKQRFEDIRHYERYLSRNGVVVLKFFLHLSKEEQKRRFLQRLERPEKNWKFSAADIRERGFWEDYSQAYEEMIRETATAHAPWFVVPADHKWFTRLVVAAAVIERLDGLDLRYPEVSQEAKQALAQAREQLLAE